jgi:methionyl-tRNA formyltransferase
MKINETKIVFMGTPNIAAKVLKNMINAGFNIVAVVAQPDKPVGRKGLLQEVPTKVVAKEYNIPVYQPIKIKLDYEFLKEINPDVIVTIAYGQIVPQGVLDIPKYGCLNLHGSILPKYRGASPIQTAIINGDTISGITLMEMIDKMDAGKMFAKEYVDILESDNTSTLFEKMGDAASNLIIRELPNYLEGKLPGIEQNEEEVTFCHMIKPEDEKINLSSSSKDIVNLIRGLADEPGAFLLENGHKFKIFKAKKINDEVTHQVGQIVKCDKFGLYLQCIDGQIALLDVQKEGKKRMDYKSFVNGNSTFMNTILY